MDQISTLTRCEQSLMDRIGYRFADAALLREALTHKSFSNEQTTGDFPHNERLEFLGDAVLDMVISHKLFVAHPGLAEGELTRIRAEVVSEAGLSRVGRELEIARCIHLGKGELRTGGREKASLIANTLEALLGAIYCDGGLAAVSPVILSLFAAAMEQAHRHKAGIDFKTRLQELMQARFGSRPDYRLVHTEGPDHDRFFTIEVRYDGRAIGQGRGRSKKTAAQLAARQALESLRD